MSPDALKKSRLEHHIEGRVPGRHRERVAAEGRAVRTRSHALPGLFRREKCADRKAAAKRLRKRHDVGLNADSLVGEQLAGAAHAGLHLVEDEQQAFLVAQSARSDLRNWCGDNATPPSPWIGFDQDRGGIRPDRFPSPLQDRRTAPDRSLRPRSEAFEVFLLPPAASVARVRPWKAPSKVMMRKRSGRPLDGLKFARSLDRAFHRLRRRNCRRRRNPQRSPRTGGRRAFVLRNPEQIGHMAKTFAPARSSASTKYGCAWPSAFTATPDVKSR